MKKGYIKQLVNNSIKQRQLLRVNFNYDNNSYFVFPLAASEKLFLCANEDDFILNGYSIRCFRDVKKTEYQEGKLFSMIKAEGIIDNLTVPKIGIATWEKVYISLKDLNKNLIVENEKAEDENFFIIGRIIKVTKTKVLMQHFDAEGVWEEEFYEIPFPKITSVSFGTRYVETFSKYL